MKGITTFIVFLLSLAGATFAQSDVVTLTFKSQTINGSYLRPDSITINNLTRGWTETIYYPDTAYTLNVGVGVQNLPKINEIQVMPNPFDGNTRINILSQKAEKVKIALFDMGGRVCTEYDGILHEGNNYFTISLTTPQMYVLSVKTISGTHSLKMENVGRAGANRIVYEGVSETNMPMIQLKSSSSHPFQLGDEMRYQGFATTYSIAIQSQEVIHMQNADESIILLFPSNIDGHPCPFTPTVTDHEGNVYNTVQIGNQCWMRDNLRTTTSPSTGTYLIPAADADYTYTGKQAFWYNNDSATYAPMNYGLLYNWNAAVDTFNTAYGETSVNTSSSNAVSVTFSGHRRGICPAGWHLPSDAEWTAMEQTQTSMDVTGRDRRGDHAGKLAGEGWSSSTTAGAPGNASDPAHNASGFSAVPAGVCNGSSFASAGYGADFWSSTQYFSYRAYDRYLYYDSAYVDRGYYSKDGGCSVRCLRDERATTAPATDLTATSATLNGTITNPDNVTVTAQGFEWKATTGGTYTQVNAMGETMAYSLTGLTANTIYTYRAFVTTANRTSYGAEVTFTTLSAGGTAVIDEKSCPEAQTVTDHEGNVYATVQIGNQCWMRDNLRTTTSPSTGTYLIPVANANYTYTGKQARWYNNDSATCAPMNYGLFYNWNAAADTFNAAYGEISVNTDYSNAVSVSFTGHRRGICPAGWHLPSDAEWTQLTNYVSSQSEYQCGGNSSNIAKALASTEGWNSYTVNCVMGNDPSTNNATGFSAVPAGYCNGSSFSSAGNNASFWSSTQENSTNACYRNLYYSNANVGGGSYGKYYGYSVRCLRD
ncbi:MAG: T9SS type A sorting domain-containing protein [Bacteroidales bacterium]|nr:T9SS type A sorting domain-containing protein [Bacteroidales bacterium]